jgi:heme exporter protein C
MNFNWYQFASPKTFYPLAEKIARICMPIACILALIGLYVAFFVAPTDFQQGQAYRIIFIHVPSAWMSMWIYLVIAFWSIVGLSLNSKLSFMVAQSLAPTGAMFTFLALLTGALWGKPMWGTWWVWDARLTSELILLFLYIGYMALQSAIEDVRRADRAGAIFAIVSAANVPIIYFSVKWWNTLHQGASISINQAPSMAITMVTGMLILALAFWAYSISTSMTRLLCIIDEREREAAWIIELRGDD